MSALTTREKCQTMARRYSLCAASYPERLTGRQKSSNRRNINALVHYFGVKMAIGQITHKSPCALEHHCQP
jgi:hypothetical protein